MSGCCDERASGPDIAFVSQKPYLGVIALRSLTLFSLEIRLKHRADAIFNHVDQKQLGLGAIPGAKG
jgi:hypothetical protein